MIPPNNIEAERAILGACFKEPDEITSALNTEDFYRKEHQELFKIIKKLHEQNKNIDLITIGEYIQKEKVNLALSDMVNIVQEPSYNIAQHIEIIKENSYLRQIISISQQYQNKAYSKAYESLDGFKNEFEQSVLNINKEVSTKTVTVGDVLLDQIDRIAERKNKKGITGLSTTINSLDIMTAGLQKGNLIILAARPSMGKTAFALQIARKSIEPALVFSLEMSKEQIAERMLVQESRVDGQAMRIGAIEDKMESIALAAQKLDNRKIYIDDNPNPSISYIRSKARRLKGLGLIVIDYLQLMQTKGVNRNLEIGDITRQLKIMARELEVPVILLSQLNRGVEQRTNKRPMMSDLRESGNIEQDADLIMFLYRDDYYNEDSDKPGVAEIIIAKQREGPTGTVETIFKKEHMSFYDMAWVREAQQIKPTKESV